FNKFFYIITFLESFHLCFMFIVTLSGYKIIKISDERAVNLINYYYYCISSGCINMSKSKYKTISKQNQTKQPGKEGDMNPEPIYDDENYIGSDKLLGKNALITGGDSGIGRAVAIAFAKEGANIVIAYLSEKEDEDANKTLD